MKIDFGPSFDSEQFLKNDWQKNIRVWRGAARELVDALDRDDIISFACDEDFSSRTIMQEEDKYVLEEGPFEEEFFDNLELPWTVLVQELDHASTDLAKLRDQFNFCASWRFDDVMASFAMDGSGVGPHFDRYDVFLVQTSGARTWKIRSDKACEDEVLPDENLKLIPSFEGEQIVLKAGDILYIPPGVPHHGVSRGESISLSFGFFTPSTLELMAAFAAEGTGSKVLSDRDLFGGQARATEFGEISLETSNAFRGAMLSLLSDEAQFRTWLGGELTKFRRNDRCAEIDNVNIENFQVFQLSEFTKIAYAQVSDKGLEVYCNGHSRIFDMSVKVNVQDLLTERLLKLQHSLKNQMLLVGWLFELGAGSAK